MPNLSLTNREVWELHSLKGDVDCFLRLAAKEIRATESLPFTHKSAGAVLMWLAKFNERLTAEGLAEIA